jgi:hypothetical protein
VVFFIAATDVASPVKEGAVALGESLQMDPPAELLERSNTKVNGSVSTSPNRSAEIANAKEAEESLLGSRVLAQKTETIKSPDGMTKSLENLTVNEDPRKDS